MERHPAVPGKRTAYEDIERSILGRVPDSAPAPAIFVLGAPRTGSTFLYQAMASAFGLPYIDNLTNRLFAQTPIVGLLLAGPLRQKDSISFSSRYGKVDGLVQPSEGSAVMTHWFGGGHPSQVVSNRILDGRETHMRSTLAAVNFFLEGPLTIKNAWNCFRTDYLASAFPKCALVWIRRDIRAAAKSDLAARHAVQGDPATWNSATPANVKELLARPPAEQVVENQFEFGKAIASTFAALPPSRCIEVWYEDLSADPRAVLRAIGDRMELLQQRAPDFAFPLGGTKEAATELTTREAEAIDKYAAANRERLRCYLKD